MTTLFSKSKTGAVRYWSVKQESNILTIEYGQKDTTSPIITSYTGKRKNEGRSNEISPEEDAALERERLILSKTRKGYSASLVENKQDLFGDIVPINLRFYKPRPKMTVELKEAIALGDVLVTRKYDGEMMVVHVNKGKVSIYSRTMLPCHHHEVGEYTWNDRFPRIVEAFESAMTSKDNHIFIGEMVADCAADAKDSRWFVARVLKSKTEKALRLQEDHKPLDYIIWDWPVLCGVPFKEPYSARLECLDNAVDDILDAYGERVVDRPFIVWPGLPGAGKKPSSYQEFIDTLQKHTLDHKWEGVIIAKASATFENELYNLRGKTDRPKGLVKLKPIHEGDFVAKWNPEADQGTYGRGHLEGFFGSAALYQYTSDGELTYICDCGGGFSDDFRKEAKKADFPLVMEVMYESRTYKSSGADTNALQFPRMVRIRHDKQIKECVDEQL